MHHLLNYRSEIKFRSRTLKPKLHFQCTLYLLNLVTIQLCKRNFEALSVDVKSC